MGFCENLLDKQRKRWYKYSKEFLRFIHDTGGEIKTGGTAIMMGRLRAMREPLKYVQGRDALLKFHEEMGYMGKRWLFVCSNSGYKACHDKIEKSFGDLDDYRRYEIFGGISSNGEINKMKSIVE